jgi:peptidoglycan/LPS O-acetylase OafA/YrhL
MIIWWLGALLAEMYCGRVKIRFNHVAYLAPLLPILIVVSLKIATPEISWGLAFTGVIAAGFAMQESGLRLRLLERLKPLGETSYTLYVIHMPIIVLISGWLMSRSANHQLPRGVLWPLAASALVLIVAYPIHLIVEKPFTRKHP